MDSLLIESKINSPSVNCSAITGLLKIVGRSMSEHPIKFYQPIDNWLVTYLKTNPTNINIHLYLDYLNTHSLECVLILLKKVKRFGMTNESCTVLIEWLYDEEDEDMEELGRLLKSITDLPFKFIKISE